jgi:hypothetical protein
MSNPEVTNSEQNHAEQNNQDQTNQDHSNLEKQIQESLFNAASILGAGAPRLRTQRPQVAWSGLLHGLTGHYTFLTDTDLVAYLKKGATHFSHYAPVGPRELELVQRIVDTTWRLSRIPHMCECLEMSSVSSAADRIIAANPRASIRNIQPQAEAAAFRVDSNEFVKLGRYETTLDRLLKSLHKELESVQYTRVTRETKSAPYNRDQCEGHKWYGEMLAIAIRLVEARKELQKKSEIIEDPPEPATESTTSEPEMVRKKRLHIVTPLTKITRESLKTAHDVGLLTEIESTLFPERNAA